LSSFSSRKQINSSDLPILPEEKSIKVGFDELY